LLTVYRISGSARDQKAGDLRRRRSKKIYPRLGSHSERELSRQCIFAPLTVFSRYIRADASKAREAPLLKMILENQVILLKRTGSLYEAYMKLI
jgi:hypothetical protein